MSKYCSKIRFSLALVALLMLCSGGPVVEVGGQQECLDVAEVLLQCSTYLVRGGMATGAPPSLMCCNELRGLSFVGAIGDTHRICKCMQAMIPSMGDLDSSHVAYLFNKCDAPFNFDLSSSGSITCP